jgi:hypothetical protein
MSPARARPVRRSPSRQGQTLAGAHHRQLTGSPFQPQAEAVRGVRLRAQCSLMRRLVAWLLCHGSRLWKLRSTSPIAVVGNRGSNGSYVLFTSLKCELDIDQVQPPDFLGNRSVCCNRLPAVRNRLPLRYVHAHYWPCGHDERVGGATRHSVL